uniref:Phosphoribosyltransferase domain-containing protein n=1 Tax=candidate division WOR-3 bacterium TaxID=2052148 RepID=A0A7C4CBH7_UNCW3
MKLGQVPLREIECAGDVVRATTPYILEYDEIAGLAQDISDTYRQLINPAARGLGPRRREANAESYTILGTDSELGRCHFVYDLEETRLAVEMSPEEATKLYRLLREQRIVVPDLELVRRKMSGNLAETVAAILWQIGAIKVSLGDLRPLFKVDDDRNFSPIYIDVKGLTNYPEVNDFVISSAALLVRNIAFDAVCGIEAGSISIAALLAHKFNRPMFFARKSRRYPEASPFEGAKRHEVFRKRVLMVDDTLVHGWTKARVVAALREWGAKVDACFVVFDRQEGGDEDLGRIGVRLCSLTNRDAALSPKIPREISFLTDAEFAEVTSYFRNPRVWHERRGLAFTDIRPPA